MKDKWMSIGFDEELQPYQEPKRDVNDITLLGIKFVACTQDIPYAVISAGHHCFTCLA